MKNTVFGVLDKNLSIGPMYTSYLYIRYMIETDLLHNMVLIKPHRSSLKQAIFKNAHGIKITEIYMPKFIPVPLWIFHPRLILCLLKAYILKPNKVIILWYPPFILLQLKFLLRHTKFLMMDSQVRLILTTSKDNFLNRLKIQFYTYFEKRIVKNAQKAAFVSQTDALMYAGADEVKLPTIRPKFSKSSVDLQKKKRLNVLLPRPDIFYLDDFHSYLNLGSGADVTILLNSDLPFTLQANWAHKKFLDDYEMAFRQADIVVLLDRGGAGVANRYITASKFGCSVFSTTDGVRGITGDWPNLIQVNDNLQELSEFLSNYINELNDLNNLNVESTDSQISGKVMQNLEEYYYPKSVELFFEDV